MKVAILSCNTGEGHNSCSAAVKEVFLNHGDSCDTVDALGFISERASRFICGWHTRIYRYMPGLFRWGYRYSEQHSKVFKKSSGVYKFLTAGADRLYRYLCDGEYELVICTHVFSALIMTKILQKYSPSIKTAFVATDYTCSPSAGESRLDWYFIPDGDLEGEFVQNGIPAQRIIPSGIPVREKFYSHIDKEEAKAQLGISAEHKHILLMCGSMGCGPIQKMVEKLSTVPQIEASVVCGTNARLQEQLQKEFASNGRIHIYGYVDSIPLLMDSADLYLTKPGGISVTEAMVKGLPMAFINAVAGCESYNMRFFLDRGAAVEADTPDALVDHCTRILLDDDERAKMADSLKRIQPANAAQTIYQKLTQAE